MRLPILIVSAVTLNASAVCAGSPENILDDAKHLLNGPGPYNWECDAPSGKFNQVHTAPLGAHAQVTGVLHVVAMHPGPIFGSVVLIGFYDRKAERGVVLRLETSYVGREKIWFWIRGDTSMPAGTTNFATQPNTETDFPFTLKLDQGIVSISVAGKDVMSKHPDQGLNGLTFGCSGAHARFSSVTVTTDAPTAS
jgi:hypothetical protein